VFIHSHIRFFIVILVSFIKESVGGYSFRLNRLSVLYIKL
jgi:hypothetical protein